MAEDENWRIDLERWLQPFLAGLSHPARRRMCPLYIAGLIGPGDRKSVQPMAARVAEVGYDQLHHSTPSFRSRRGVEQRSARGGVA
jgi:SRSO17 transposase